jgi:hypothetical protein
MRLLVFRLSDKAGAFRRGHQQLAEFWGGAATAAFRTIAHSLLIADRLVSSLCVLCACSQAVTARNLVEL